MQVSLDGYARATVRLADEPPPAPAPTAAPLTNPRPSPRDAVELYDEHWMFHGPSFQGVRHIGDLGDDGVDGVIEALATPGATLDNAGQLYGWWVMATASSDFHGPTHKTFSRFGAYQTYELGEPQVPPRP